MSGNLSHFLRNLPIVFYMLGILIWEVYQVVQGNYDFPTCSFINMVGLVFIFSRYKSYIPFIGFNSFMAFSALFLRKIEMDWQTKISVILMISSICIGLFYHLYFRHIKFESVSEKKSVDKRQKFSLPTILKEKLNPYRSPALLLLAASLVIYEIVLFILTGSALFYTSFLYIVIFLANLFITDMERADYKLTILLSSLAVLAKIIIIHLTMAFIIDLIFSAFIPLVAIYSYRTSKRNKIQ